MSAATTGSLSFVIIDDAGNHLSGAEVSLVGTQPYVQQLAGGSASTYYQNFYGKTDASGAVTFADIPLGPYSYTIKARGHADVACADATCEAQVMPLIQADLTSCLP